MLRTSRTAVSLGLSILAASAALAESPKPFAAGAATGHVDLATKPLASRPSDPTEFGVSDTTITIISATQFLPQWSGGVAGSSSVLLPSLWRYCSDCTVAGIEYFATLDLPAGAVIDRIGVNNATDTESVMGFALWQRDLTGNGVLLDGFSFPAHGGDTDYSGPLSILEPNHLVHELVLNVEQAPSANPQYFGWVEVWWHRTVSPAPQDATFDDVPTSHPFFQFVEALVDSGVTAGCGNFNYCPDLPVTRGQMAVFLAKALGLHWND